MLNNFTPDRFSTPACAQSVQRRHGGKHPKHASEAHGIIIPTAVKKSPETSMAMLGDSANLQIPGMSVGDRASATAVRREAAWTLLSAPWTRMRRGFQGFNFT